MQGGRPGEVQEGVEQVVVVCEYARGARTGSCEGSCEGDEEVAVVCECAREQEAYGRGRREGARSWWLYVNMHVSRKCTVGSA